MKTLSTREFFKSPLVVKQLHPGQSFAVTDNGKPSFTVTKAGKRPHRTKEELLRRSRAIFKRKGVKFDVNKAIRRLKGA
ncbi:MAG: hypothetical protein C5B50_13005 [Verrucomicrobia bacterium]|nr:MAG: hypothetical protein C5B50_13005 [Verrucomicrobiota bacterium]